MSVLLAAAMAKSVNDAANERILAAGREKGRQFLAQEKEKILDSAGVKSFSELRAQKDIQQMRDAVVAATDNFNDIRRRAGGDDVLADNARDLLIDTITSTEPKILDTLSSQSQKQEEFTNFMVEMKAYTAATSKTLDEHAAAITGLGERVTGLSKSIDIVNTELKRQGRDQSIISDFVFDEMPPRKKAESLKAGFLQERFECTESTAQNCEKQTFKAELIEKFEREADIQDYVQTAGIVASGITDINTIATNFGIDSPELNQASEVGNAAMGAVTAYMSGNPLGAVAAVSGLFGAKKDPNAATMQYLKQIDRKLDIIIENQRILLQAVNALSEQVQKGFEAIDERLSRMEFEQNSMSQGVRLLISNNWASCYSVVEFARSRSNDGEYTYIDPKQETFRSFEDIRRVATVKGQDFRTCLTTVGSDMSKIGAVQYFGNFIDARWAISEKLVPDAGTLANPDEATKWQSLLQRFDGVLVAPAVEIAADYASKRELSRTSMFALLASPAAQTLQLRTQISDRAATPFECYKSKAGDERLYSLFCQQEQNAEQQATDLLSRPILADMTVDVAHWVILLAQIADVYNQKTGRFNETLEEVASQEPGASAGRQMIEKSIRVLDVAVAVYNELNGGFTALAAIDALNDFGSATGDKVPAATAKAERVLQLLGNNPYLAENVATLLLEQNLKPVGREYKPPLEKVYRQAFDMAEQNDQAPGFFLEGLFDNLHFVVVDGTPAIHLQAGGATADIRLPAPHQFVQGRLVFPPRFYDLLDARMALVDRLFDYDILSYVATSDRSEFASQLVR
ncbi:hypothetical protein EN801_002400 [Mesorhizobium sp. M00.F.Ca.ET.158.01.1.1]|nr:hypothetical protein EN801_002400 [Mesorhizobium sp. M00.F.Ca.ET.158.01.1.1]